jgi:hypothetical protein
MTPTEVIAEMRTDCSRDAQVQRWADALEAAMREPVAEVIDTPYGPAMTGRHMLNIEALPPGTNLYAMPPDQSAEIKRLHGMIGHLQLALDKEAARHRQDNAEIERLRAVVVLAYQSAYSRGHEDTVEGCVNLNCMEETLCADEFMEEQDALAGKEGKP